MIQIQIQTTFVCKYHSQCDKDTMDFAIERVLHLKPQIPFGNSKIKLPAIIVQTKFLVDVSKVFSDFLHQRKIYAKSWQSSFQSCYFKDVKIERCLLFLQRLLEYLSTSCESINWGKYLSCQIHPSS